MIVSPVVIDAGEAVGLAARLHGNQRAAVCAAVLEGVDRAGSVTRDYHRHLADEGGDEALRLGKLRFEAEIAPRRAVKDALLLALVDVGVLVHPVRDAR